MMRRLKTRIASHTAPNEPRSRRMLLIRWTYFILMIALSLWIADFLVGDRVFLRADGMVVGEPAVVASEFPVTVRSVLVREGATVRAGEVAAIVSSQTVTETIAKLSAEIAVRTVRQGELRIRRKTIDAMLPLAENRQQIARNARNQLESLFSRRDLTTNQRTTAVDNEYKGVQDYEVLKSERSAIDTELTIIDATLSDANKAIENLRNLYDDGRLLVPMDGIVTRLAAGRGAVVRSSEPIVELHSNRRYVHAQIPIAAFYEIKEGDPVLIRAGRQVNRGVIASIKPFAAAQPREFQSAFTPVERHQVMRIEFATNETPPPLFSKVKVESARSWLSSLAF
jgi:multidrug resistance efflux pump